MLTRSHHWPALVILALLFATPPACSAGPCWGMEAHRIVTHKTIEALPPPLRTLLSAHLDAVLERAVEPTGAWQRTPRYKTRDPWHYLMLDTAATTPAPEERLRAALAFPSKQHDAVQLFRDQDNKRGGSLPWQLQEYADQLGEAIENGDVDEIVKSVGYVIHFSADASNPFCATRNQHGQETGNIRFGQFDMGEPLFAHQDVAQRLGWELVRRNAHRYRESIDTESFRDLPATDVTYRTLEVMVTSLEGMPALAQADAEILAHLGITDAEGFLARIDEYYELLDERCGDHCVENLRRGASLAAALITGVWERVGAPDPVIAPRPVSEPERPRDTATTRPPAPSQSAPPPPVAVALEYVASKQSKIYHRSDCKHAEKINPVNMLHFSTVEEAAASGKRPCRICLPEQAEAAAPGANGGAVEPHRSGP